MNMVTRVVLAMVVGFGVGATVSAQDSVQPGSQAVWLNAKGGAVVGRRPGLMVQKGLVRYRNAQNDMIERSRQGPTITDTEADRPTKVITQLKADVIRILFENLTALIVAYNVQQRTNAGLSPLNPTPSDDGGTTPDLSDLLGDITGPAAGGT